MSERDTLQMSSQRPYLLRALHEWISDNGLTPYLLVNARHPGVHVPPQSVQDGQVVLNIAERAVHLLSLGNEYITFNARFSGVSHEVFVPVGAVVAIYAKETGQGMALPVDAEVETGSEANAPAAAPAPAGEAPSLMAPEDDEPPPQAPLPPKRGHLRVVK